MKTPHLTILVPGVFAAAAFVLAVSVGAQTPSPPATPPGAKSPQAASATGHHKDRAAAARHDADMKAECQGMMAMKQGMQDKLRAMDATLDNLVAEMNAAKESKRADAMEKPMAAVINELVTQRKALRSMTMEIQSPMMAHMIHHMNGQGTNRGAMQCPMMKTGNAPEPKVEEKTHQL